MENRTLFCFIVFSRPLIIKNIPLILFCFSMCVYSCTFATSSKRNKLFLTLQPKSNKLIVQFKHPIIMKTFMFTLALSVLSLGNFVEAQDGKSLRTKTQMTEQLLASLPAQDIYTAPTPTFIFSAADQQMISKLPLSDELIQTPHLTTENTAVAKTPVTTSTTQKIEVKTATDARRIGDK